MIRRYATFANVVSFMALFVALGSGAYAVKLKLKPNQVKTRNIASQAVTSPKMADGAVTSPKMADGAVTSPKMADGAVTSPKMADGAVTSPKISANAIDGSKVADGSVGIADVNNSLHQNCPGGTTYVQGACVDSSPRGAAGTTTQGAGETACLNLGGRLPEPSELVVLLNRGATFATTEWTIVVTSATEGVYVFQTGTVDVNNSGNSFGYRCAFDPVA